MRAITSSLLLIVLAATYTETRADPLAHFVKNGHITKEVNLKNFRAAGEGSGDGEARDAEMGTVVAEMKAGDVLVINLEDPDDEDLHYEGHYLSVGASVLASRSAGFCADTSTTCDTVGATGGACATGVKCQPLIAVTMENSNTGGIDQATVKCDADARTESVKEYRNLYATLVGFVDNNPSGELICGAAQGNPDYNKLATCWAQYDVMTAGPYLRPTTLCQGKFGAYTHANGQKTKVTVTAHANLVGTIGVGIGINTPPTYLKDMADWYNPQNQLASGEYFEMFSRYNLDDRDDDDGTEGYENMHEFGYIGITWAVLLLVWILATVGPKNMKFSTDLTKYGKIGLLLPCYYPKDGNVQVSKFSTDPHKWFAMASWHALTSPIMYFAAILRHAHEAPEAAIDDGTQFVAVLLHVILPVLLIVYLQLAMGSPVFGHFQNKIRQERKGSYSMAQFILLSVVAIWYVGFSPFALQQFVFVSYALMCGGVLVYIINLLGLGRDVNDDQPKRAHGWLHCGASGFVNGEYAQRTSTKPQYSSVVTDISSGGAPVLGGQVRYKDSLA